MFKVDPETRAIELHRGDTGVIGITAKGYTFGASDRAIFTLRGPSGTEIMKEVKAMTNNRFEIEFKNSTTDYLEPGVYSWDVRYVKNPIYVHGEIIDGDAVFTPEDAMSLTIRATVGQI